MMTPGTTSTAGDKSRKRAEPRKAVKHSAILHYNGGQIPVVIHDMSRSGVRFALNQNRTGMVVEGKVMLEVPGALRLPLNIRWQNKTLLGAAFDVPASRKATLQQQIDRVISRYGR